MEQEYNVYKGLQKPFCLFGLKGINVTYGCVGFGGGLVLFLAGYFLSGFLLGMLLCLLCLCYCGYKISYHIQNGLHNKEKYPGVWVVKNLVRPCI